MAWHGVFPAAVTHFRDDDSIDFAATGDHVAAMIASGVDGMIVLGTVGENSALTSEEKLAVGRAIVDRVDGAVPVLSGVAETSTASACRYAEAVASAGADGLMVLPAMVYKSDVRETQAHVRAVAAATDLPIMLYNNPVSYGVDLPPAACADLGDVATIVAIKESSDDPRRITDLHNACGGRYRLFCGVDDLVMESFAAGIDGWVSGLVNAFPAENRRLWDLLTEGAWDEARALYRWYMPLLHLDTHAKLVQCIKLAVAEVGSGSERTRPPRLPLIGAEREQVLTIIRTALANRPPVTPAVSA